MGAARGEFSKGLMMKETVVWLVISMFDIYNAHDPKIMTLIVNSVTSERECVEQVSELNAGGYKYQCLRVVRVEGAAR